MRFAKNKLGKEQIRQVSATIKGALPKAEFF
jgi:hypothetical protein